MIPMPEILREWVGYNGKTTIETNPDGSIKKRTKHHKIWAAALTDTGHIYVRYGPAKHPLHLTEQIIRPRRGVSEHEALIEAERIFQEKVDEKLLKKGYDAISFDAPPHYVPSFSHWRMSDEPEEVVAPLSERETAPEPAQSLLSLLQDLRQHHKHHCSQCGMQHPCSLIDLQDGWLYPADALITLLSDTEQGNAWLSLPCLHQEHSLVYAETYELLARIIDLPEEGTPGCALKGGVSRVPYDLAGRSEEDG
jgi:hypothetical protein